MVSTPIPKSREGEIRATYGQYNTIKGYAKMGNTHRHFGYLVEYLRQQSQGFKQYTTEATSKGFHRNDVIAKLMYNFRPDDFLHHIIELKNGIRR